MDLLPDDIARQLANGALPWNRSWQVDIDAFLARYTLHDSNWVALQVDCAYEDAAVAAIAFDPIWNQAVAPASARCADWPILFLRFSCVSSMKTSGFADIGGVQRGISSVRVARNSEEQVCTEIIDHYGASVRIEHWPLVSVLVLATDGEIVTLGSQGS